MEPLTLLVGSWSLVVLQRSTFEPRNLVFLVFYTPFVATYRQKQRCFAFYTRTFSQKGSVYNDPSCKECRENGGGVLMSIVNPKLESFIYFSGSGSGSGS